MKRKIKVSKKIVWSLIALAIFAVIAGVFSSPEMNKDDQEFIIHSN